MVSSYKLAMKKTAPKNVKNKAALQKKGPKPRHLFGHGRLSYIQIPAVNVRDSARFYAGVFGWQIRGAAMIISASPTPPAT